MEVLFFLSKHHVDTVYLLNVSSMIRKAGDCDTLNCAIRRPKHWNTHSQENHSGCFASVLEAVWLIICAGVNILSSLFSRHVTRIPWSDKEIVTVVKSWMKAQEEAKTSAEFQRGKTRLVDSEATNFAMRLVRFGNILKAHVLSVLNAEKKHVHNQYHYNWHPVICYIPV